MDETLVDLDRITIPEYLYDEAKFKKQHGPYAPKFGHEGYEEWESTQLRGQRFHEQTGHIAIVATAEPEVASKRGFDEAERVMFMPYMERFDYMIDFHIENAKSEINQIFNDADRKLVALRDQVIQA